MKTALITTTINVPTVLELYRRHGPDVGIFIAGDQKSPHEEIEKLCDRIGGYVRYLHPDEQAKWKSSELFGWNTIQRRVFALLEAIAWGAEIIVSIDTDDFPTSSIHFSHITWALSSPYHGLELRTSSGWVDPGSLIEPPTPHRGMPVRLDRFYVHPAINRTVGIVASTVLGSCDLAAVDRVVGTPKRSVASELAQSGVIVDPTKNWTIFNSEAVAFRRELAPAMMVLPFVGRYDDLYASLICQRVMSERGYVVQLGQPIVWHEREDRNILKDLRGEIDGMENIEEFARLLDGIVMEQDASVTSHVAQCWYEINDRDFFPARTIDAASAFLEDVEGVL